LTIRHEATQNLSHCITTKYVSTRHFRSWLICIIIQSNTTRLFRNFNSRNKS